MIRTITNAAIHAPLYVLQQDVRRHTDREGMIGRPDPACAAAPVS
jgi:hypothetical protein